MPPLVHFNQGHSIANALRMIRDAAGGRVRTSSSHLRGSSSAIAAADVMIAEPKADPEGDPTRFAGEMADICAEAGVRLLVPQRGATAISRNRGLLLDRGVGVLCVADADTLDSLEDKSLFTSRARALGLPIARTREVRSTRDLHAAVGELRDAHLAACVKPPIGVFASGYRMITDASPFRNIVSGGEPSIDMHSLSHAFDVANRDGAGPVLLVCEHLPGDEWSVDVVCSEGRTIVAVARRKFGPLQEIHVEGEAIRIAETTVAGFGLSGLVNVQMKTARDRRLALLEVNTRMSGGCLQTAFAGVNLPWITVALELGLMSESDVPKPVGGAVLSSIQDAIRIDGDRHETFSKLDLTGSA